MTTKPTKDTKASAVVAKSNDGSIQITFTIPRDVVDQNKEKAAEELGKDLEIPGFRKGKAPVAKVIEHVGEANILEKVLSQMLPKLFSDAIEENQLKPNIYPKFEVLNTGDTGSIQVRALTCEIPEFELGDYKKFLKGSGAADIWVPGKAEQKEPNRQDKEQIALKALLENVKLTIPKMLIEEEVNSRLSKLLERIEKLGLTLESYLQSIGKNVQTLRSEYEKQAEQDLKIDLILSKLADTEKIEVKKSEIESAVNASAADKHLTEELNNPEKLRLLEMILLRRKALDIAVSLI